MSSAVDRVLGGLEAVKRNGSGWSARCPCPSHGQRRGDRNPSLAVSEGDDGRALVACHAGCTAEEVVGALGLSLRDLFADGSPPADREIVASYPYHDEGGRVLFEVVRYRPKRFRQRRPDGRGGYAWDIRGVRRALYRLPAVIEGVRSGARVFVVEGEKDVEALNACGEVATTNPGGAEKWRPEFNEFFRGADVVIVAHRDEPGYRHARDVERNLRGVARTVTIREAAEGKDASDHLAAGYGPNDFAPFRVADDDASDPRPAIPTASAENYGVVTDAANATRLHALHGARLRYVDRWGTWLVWSGTVWERDARATLVAELAKDVGRAIVREEFAKNNADSKLMKHGLGSLNAARIRGMIELARGLPGILVDHEALDADPWLLGVRNGVVDLRACALRDARPADLMTMQAPVAYDPEAVAPRWQRAIAEWFPDAEVRDYVQRIVGAALVGEQRDHVFVIHYGVGANGKGTFVRAITNVLGAYAVTPHMSLLVEQKGSEHDTVKATLFRARLAVASETARRVTLAEASVKNLTGRDRISCRRLYENPWEFEPSHSLWLQTNHLPRISGRDHGIWRRVRVVPWTETFAAAAEDLDAALAAEAPGILAWAVEGTRRWQERGLDEPRAVVDATLAYRRAEDVLGRFQEDTGLAFEGSISVAEMNRRYKEWCEEQDLKPRMGELRDWLLENGADQVRDGKKRTRM